MVMLATTFKKVQAKISIRNLGHLYTVVNRWPLKSLQGTSKLFSITLSQKKLYGNSQGITLSRLFFWKF